MRELNHQALPLYAVMGNPVAHSLSPIIHQEFAQQTGHALRYEKIEVPKPLFEAFVVDFFQRQRGQGLNITLPFKERAFAMADVKSPRCLVAEAANTLWMVGESLHADNTDGIGLMRDLSRYIDITNKSIVLLGAGGAARGILAELLHAKPAQLTLSNRTLSAAHALQKTFPSIHTCRFEELTQSYDVIINATSASLSNQNLPLPKSILNNHPFCYDVAYRKNGTPFVKWAQAHGTQAVDGIGMLIEQAAEAFYIWHKIMPNTTSIHVDLNQFI